MSTGLVSWFRLGCCTYFDKPRIVTTWASLEAIHAFAGINAESAVVPAKVHDMMVEYDRVVRHYEVVA